MITEEKLNIEDNIKDNIEDKKTIENKKERSKYWDIVKGLGIVSIVIGHVCCPETIRRFVYTFHLVIFYFVAAYFYDENKYGDKPMEYFAIRFKNMWVKYFFYSTILVLLHNFFFKYNFYINSESYTFSDLIVNISKNLIFTSSEPFTAPLWFVPTLIIANGLFATIVYISRKISKIMDKEKNRLYMKYISIIIITLFIGNIGVFLNQNKLEILYQVNTSFLILPIYTLAYFLKIIITKYSKQVKKIKWYIYLIISILSAIFLYFVVVKKQITIDLLQEQIMNGYMIYIVFVIGICFCLSIAKIIEKIPLMNVIMAVIGKNSFTIMAIHFACIKPLEVLYLHIMNYESITIIKKLIILNIDKLWILYTIIGVAIPTLIALILNKTKNKIKKRIEQKV